MNINTTLENIKWETEPHLKLRAYPDRTLFLLNAPTGIWVCHTLGNLATDDSWKAQRLNDFRFIRLEKYAKREFVVIAVPARDVDKGSTGQPLTASGL